MMPGKSWYADIIVWPIVYKLISSDTASLTQLRANHRVFANCSRPGHPAAALKDVVTRMRSLVVACLVCHTLATTCTSADDLIASRIAATRKTHAEQCDRLRQEVETAFEKRERSARASGDKKQVDQLAVARSAFDENGELPSFTPNAAVRRVATARVALEGAYGNAIRQLIKSNQDEEAQALEKELRDYLIASHSLRFLCEVTPTMVEVDHDMYSNTGKFNGQQVKIDDVDQLHSILLHPKSGSQSLASYPVSRLWSQVRGEVFIPQIGEERGRIASPIVFELVGDNKVLWASKPIQEFDKRQAFQVDIDKVETLHLRVKCPGAHDYARAMWIEPVLIR